MREPTAVRVLLLIREGTVTNWTTLCEAFGEHPTETHTGTFLLAKVLDDLQLAGIIKLESDINPGSFVFPTGKFHLAPNWGRMQTVLGLSLRELARANPREAIFVEPYFGRPWTPESFKSHDLFMLMPFTPELRPVYDDHIKPVAERVGLSIKRGDDFFTTHDVMNDIWLSICEATAVIADCTGRNPNVFYEIGIAHTVGKPVILITQDPDDVPFDIRNIRFIEYAYTPPGMKKFEDVLDKTLSELRDSNSQNVT